MTDQSHNEYDRNIVNQPEIEYRKAKYPFVVKNQTAEGKVWYSTHCPVCFWDDSFTFWNSMVDRGAKFCRRCGQKIKWEEDDERKT